MGNLSLKRQLILLVILVLIIPMITINAFYYLREVDRIEKNRRVLAENIVSQIALGYSSMIDGFQLGKQAVVAGTLDWLRKPPVHYDTNRVIRSVELERLLTTVDTSLPFVTGIVVYDYANRIAGTSKKGYQKPDLWESLEDIFPSLENNGDEIFIGPRQIGYSRGAGGEFPTLFSYFLRLNTITDTNDLVILQIDISQDSLQSMLQYYGGNILQQVGLYSARGVIVEQKNESIDPGVQVRAPVRGTEWFVEASLATPSIAETGSNFRLVALFLAFLIAVYTVTVAFIFSRSIAGPVQLMAKELSDIQSGTGKDRVTIPSSSELSQIASGVNDMLDGITLLHNKVIAHERSQHHAEIAALQAMIQPHFLFNTLETIRGLSLSGETKSAADAAKNLSKMLRYTIGGGDYHTTLKEELAISKDYLALQSLRFDSRMNVTFEVESGADEIDTPRWILQPVLENVFKHAITPSTSRVNVRIMVEITGGKVLLSVIDDGPGLSEQDLFRITADFELPIDQTHNAVLTGAHGLANVHHRLQLVYGKDAGLRVTSTPGRGSEFCIEYPVHGAETG